MISVTEEFEFRYRPNPQCGVRTVNLKWREPATIQNDKNNKVIITLITLAWLMVAWPSILSNGWYVISCRSWYSTWDLRSSSDCVPTSWPCERSNESSACFQHQWEFQAPLTILHIHVGWSWGLQIKGRITNTICNNCRRWQGGVGKVTALSVYRATRCPSGEALSGQSPGLFLVHLTRM